MKPFSIPLYNKRAVRLSKEEVDAFARRTGWIDDCSVIDPETTIVEKIPLVWWDYVELLIARDLKWTEGLVAGAWLLYKQPSQLHGTLHRLNGTSPPIHEMNARNVPQLREETILSYLGFFCTFVHGGCGPFAIVENVKELLVYRAKIGAIEQHMRPAKLIEVKESEYHCEALIHYKNVLFFANFVVQPSGLVSMVSDELLVEDTGGQINFGLKVKERPVSD